MSTTRREFFEGLAAGTVLLSLPACGGGGGSGSGGFGGGCGATGIAIAGNHGHTLAVPATDLTSIGDKSYGMPGTAGHDHTVTFTPGQLATLKSGGSVTVTSTSGSDATYAAHTHVVTANCP